MLHTFTTRKTRRYRWYVCAKAHNEGVATCPKARVSAGQFEAFVVNQVKVMGTDEELLACTANGVARLSNDDRIDLEQLRVAMNGFYPIWEHLAPREQERILRLLIERITYHPDSRESEFELRACGVEALAKEATA